ncbi:hypothetical protein [Pyrococcus sp. ST04]|uniref:hypothetical protein n=1 Tax=Pyrococcus sp. ST04 TaxID=1183377 RepID=UPI0002605D4F|nr:hypothetical protein [Pyrococcus sp. ST04]AFK22472.1 hypothetical protein Py04_0884 [Pyrococcus sp. ST04]
MDEARVHNILTFYLPILIFGSFVYGFLNGNSQMLIYAIGYLVTYFAIRLEIHHQEHKWGAHRDTRFVKALVISNLVVVGFLLPTILAHSTKANFNRNLVMFFIAGAFIYATTWRIIDKLSEDRVGIFLLVLSLLVLIKTKSLLEPLLFALLSLWACLILKHSLAAYATKGL